MRTTEPKSSEKFRTNKRLLVNQLHIVVVDKEQKGEVAIDAVIPADRKGARKDGEKEDSEGAAGTDVEVKMYNLSDQLRWDKP